MRVNAIAFLMSCFLACDGRGPEQDAAGRASPEAEPTPPIVTDSTEYSLRADGPGWRTTIGFEYRAGADTVYVVNCNGAILMNLQKREEGEWKDAWFAEGNACLSPPLVVPPSGILRGRIEVWGAWPGDSSFNAFRVAEIDGEYRLVWHQPVHDYRPDAAGFGAAIPLAERVSNVFRLKRVDTER